MSGPRGGPMVPRPPLPAPWRCAAPQLHAFTTSFIISGDLIFNRSQNVIPVQALPSAGSCHQPSQNFNVRFAHASMSKVCRVVRVLVRQHSRALQRYALNLLCEKRLFPTHRRRQKSPALCGHRRGGAALSALRGGSSPSGAAPASRTTQRCRCTPPAPQEGNTMMTL